MTHDDRFQIAATNPTQRRGCARMRNGVRASGRDAVGDVVASGRGRTAVAGDGIGGGIEREIFRLAKP
jgi:hypothetical protein